MAVFQSKYRELAFYVDGRKYKFSNGEFSSNDAKVIAVLAKAKDVKCVDSNVETKEPEVKEAAKPEPKPAAKAASKPKASAK